MVKLHVLRKALKLKNKFVMLFLDKITDVY